MWIHFHFSHNFYLDCISNYHMDKWKMQNEMKMYQIINIQSEYLVVSDSLKSRGLPLPGYCVLTFPRQEYWSGLPFLSPWESQKDPWLSGWTHISCVSCIGSGFFTTEPPGKPNYRYSLTYAIKWEKNMFIK